MKILIVLLLISFASCADARIQYVSSDIKVKIDTVINPVPLKYQYADSFAINRYVLIIRPVDSDTPYVGFAVYEDSLYTKLDSAFIYDSLAVIKTLLKTNLYFQSQMDLFEGVKAKYSALVHLIQLEGEDEKSANHAERLKRAQDNFQELQDKFP